MTLRRAIARIQALLHKQSLDRELQHEVEAHLEMAERDAAAAGLSPEEARRVARRRFGAIEKMKEEHRERRSFLSFENLLRDVRYGLSGLARDPGFSVVLTGVLALGIGANVAMFSLVDAVLLKPLPFSDPDRLVRVWEVPRPGSSNATSTLDFLDWRRLSTAYEALSAEIPLAVSMTGSGVPVRLKGKAVTADYFRVFTTNALRGRTFMQGEDQPGAARVIVISHAAWQTHFGGDADILNRRILLDGESHQIVGILPPGAFDRDEAVFWKPLIFTPDQYLRDSHWLQVHGRLHQGINPEQAQKQMSSIQASLADVTPIWKRDWTIAVEPLSRLLVGNNLRQSIVVAFGAVALVLLIACANVANLLLAKGASRRKEMAVRTALGASRGRLISQLLTESLVLCLLGGAAGLGVASLLIEAAGPFLKQTIPYTASLALDYRVFAFAAAVAFAVGILVGALPALQTSVGGPGQSLRQTGRGTSGEHHRMRRFIVVAEVALSLVLVCGAMLLFKSLSNLQRLETGIRIENIVTVGMDLPKSAYPTSEKAAAFYQSLAEQIRAVPSVRQVALTTHLPLNWIGNGEAVEVPGVKGMINVRFKRVDPGYFDALGIPMLAGRGVTERDREGASRVVVINQALAARLADTAGLSNPVGRTVSLHCPRYIERGAVTQNVEIVGIIRSERVAGPGAPDPNVVYVPLAQVPSQTVKLIVRAEMEPTAIVSGIRRAVRQIDGNLPIGDIATMEQVRQRTLNGASRPAWVIGVFACIAALLAAIGLYGVLSQAVTQQRKEIGIRMALGAQSRDVVSHILRNAIALIVAGLFVGVFGAFALTRVIRNLLFQVSPLDPVAIAFACLTMMLIGVLAGVVPAGRAARLDPVTTLREDG